MIRRYGPPLCVDRTGHSRRRGMSHRLDLRSPERRTSPRRDALAETLRRIALRARTIAGDRA